MPVRIRLMRMGAKKRPFYRIVVTQSTSPRDGRAIDQIGYYDPLTTPSNVKVRADRALSWLQRGAQPSEAVGLILKREGILDQFEAARAAAAPAARPAAEGSAERAAARKASRSKRREQKSSREKAQAARRTARRQAKKAAAEAAE